MLSSLNLLVAAAAVVIAHGDHGHDQTPIEGPHKQLWYNTLPGDGGTQVCVQHDNFAFKNVNSQVAGRLSLLRDLHLWSPALSSLPCKR
jgi:hypothetical protein